MYLEKFYLNYNIDDAYRNFVNHLLNKLNFINNRNLKASIITQGLRLNILEKEHLDNFDIDK